MNKPVLSGAYVAANATVVGEVTLEKDVSVWYGAVLRGDSGTIRLGPRCAVQDNVTVHGETVLEEDVVVGHNAVLHTCRIGKGSLIGMNATVMNGAQLGEGKKSVAYSLVFRNAERTLTDEEADGAVKKILKRLEAECGAVLRS